MANFSTPFAQEAERRFPTSQEQQQGFACGPADQELFNGLFHRLEAEIGEVITHAGLTPSNNTLTQLREAIVAIIAAETGQSDTLEGDQFILMSQARARLPIYPQVLNSQGKIPVSSPATGMLRVPGGVSFLHRGIHIETTEQVDLTTQASRIYHLRWSPDSGYQLKDLALADYNPVFLAETDAQFDTRYDDMLMARVITNSSNIATITNLINQDRLWSNQPLAGQNWRTPVGESRKKVADFSLVLNWARTPQSKSFNLARRFANHSEQVNDTTFWTIPYGGGYGDPMLDAFPLNRYGSQFSMVWDEGDLSGIDIAFDVSMSA